MSCHRLPNWFLNCEMIEENLLKTAYGLKMLYLYIDRYSVTSTPKVVTNPEKYKAWLPGSVKILESPGIGKKVIQAEENP